MREAYQELMGSQDQVDNQDNPDYRVNEDFQEQVELEVCKVREDNLDHQDLTGREVNRVAPELEDQMGRPDLEDSLGDLEDLEKMEQMVNQEEQEHQDWQDLGDLQV